MTSNTTPSGECSGTSKDATDAGEKYNYYKAFNGVSSGSGNAWACIIDSNPQRLIYDFIADTIKPYLAQVKQGSSSSIYFRTTYKLQGSNDGISWDDLAIENNGVYNSDVYTVLSPISSYRYVAWYSADGGGFLYTLQFYGRADI
jgi:hypothetical protein